MKKLLTLLLVFLIVGITFGQDYRSNDYGLIFGFDNATPESITENGIGAMIHLNNFALRPMIQFGTTKLKNGTEETSSIFGFGAALIKHTNENRVSPYYGGGLNYSTYKEKEENGATMEVSGSILSIYGLLGVDFSICKNVTLGAEYHLGYQSTSSKTEYSSQYSKTLNKINYSSQYGGDSESSYSAFGFSSVLVILTIYLM